jgi:hypothetical protein
MYLHRIGPYCPSASFTCPCWFPCALVPRWLAGLVRWLAVAVLLSACPLAGWLLSVALAFLSRTSAEALVAHTSMRVKASSEQVLRPDKRHLTNGGKQQASKGELIKAILSSSDQRRQAASQQGGLSMAMAAPSVPMPRAPNVVGLWAPAWRATVPGGSPRRLTGAPLEGSAALSLSMSMAAALGEESMAAALGEERKRRGSAREISEQKRFNSAL